MSQFLFIGDGDRDLIALPELVKRLTKQDFAEESRAWRELRGHGRGFGKKLKLAARIAIDRGLDGLVAVVDQDRAPARDRLRELAAARAEDRARISLPTALGEARPHGEAWLLDDSVAVRRALELPAHEPIPSVTKTRNPKKELESLLAKSPKSGIRPRVIYGDIAEHVDSSRCAHASETGFAEFAAEVEKEITPVLSK